MHGGFYKEFSGAGSFAEARREQFGACDESNKNLGRGSRPYQGYGSSDASNCLGLISANGPSAAESHKLPVADI